MTENKNSGETRDNAIPICDTGNVYEALSKQKNILRGKKVRFDSDYERIEAGGSVYIVYYTENGPVWFNLTKN